ncbi:AIR synthase related protein [Patescibacteria group bacterium]
MKEREPLTYAESGVDYGAIDPFKRAAQAEARQTDRAAARLGVQGVPWSRGESCYLMQLPNRSFLAHVEEGLGTKNLVTDDMYELTGRSFYDHIAQDTVAMIVNDMVTLGARPVSVAMHLAVGSNGWFADARRYQDLIRGWRAACELAGCTWGGGETPVLKGLVAEGGAVLAGSAVGIAKPGRVIRPDRIRPGDAIVLLAGSGIHANGLTLARRVAERAPDGYLTPLSDGRPYGEALLDPTPIYVPAVEAVQESGANVHYAVNVTGHGWRKLMRVDAPYTYVIDRLPEPQPVFGLMRKVAGLDNREAYGNLNMGAGFALYVPFPDVDRTLAALADRGFEALLAGRIELTDAKSVVIEPLGLTFKGSSLAIR